MTEITLLNKNIQKTYEWLDDIIRNAGWNDNDQKQALSVLRAVLHCLRDHLLINNLAHFSAQLPVVIRGLLFEGWNPENNLLGERERGAFITRIEESLPTIYQDIDIESAVNAALTTICNMIDIGEVEKLLKVLPKDIIDFFPAR